MNKLNVFLACTGLDHIVRGYESFSRECFDHISNSSDFNLYLIKGSGYSYSNEKSLPSIRRNTFIAKTLGKAFNKDGYFIEQLSFFLLMIPLILSYRPVLIYYSDFSLGTWLWHLRRITGLKYKLLFSNGAPNGPPFTRMDYVQQLLPLYLEEAIEGGTPIEKQFLLPYAIKFDVDIQASGQKEIASIKETLSLPIDKRIILSVGAVNSKHKRMDFVINEFSQLDLDRYYLVILGQMDENSQEIVDLANQLLPTNSYTIKQVSRELVKSHMRIADYFILASFSEGLPRVLLEALTFGLLPIVHDYKVTRELLGNFAVYNDLGRVGTIKKSISEVDARNVSKEILRNFAEQNFSWAALSPRYIHMINQAING